MSKPDHEFRPHPLGRDHFSGCTYDVRDRDGYGYGYCRLPASAHPPRESAIARLISRARQFALDAALAPMRNDHQGTWAAFEREIAEAAVEHAGSAHPPRVAQGEQSYKAQPPEVGLPERAAAPSAPLAPCRVCGRPTGGCCTVMVEPNPPEPAAPESEREEWANALLEWQRFPDYDTAKDAIYAASDLISALAERARVAEERAEELEGGKILNRAAIKNLRDERDALRAEVERLRGDKERLDWLEGEMEREKFSLSRGVPVPRSLFRSNTPVTRDAIDAALRRAEASDGEGTR